MVPIPYPAMTEISFHKSFNSSIWETHILKKTLKLNVVFRTYLANLHHVAINSVFQIVVL